MRILCSLLTLALAVGTVSAQQPSPPSSPQKNVSVYFAELEAHQPQAPLPDKKDLSLQDAVSIFIKQNLHLIAAKYDVDSAEADKLTARLRPNPEFETSFEDLPLDFTGQFFKEQEITYGVSQTFELGGKRHKRIDSANANAELAKAGFEATMWQLTNDLKRRYYTVVLASSLLKLAQDNQKTFQQIVGHNTELYKLGEIAGLDLKRLEVEKVKFDTDVASAKRDYEVALRDFRVALGGDYRLMDVTAAGSIEYKPYQFSLADLQNQALAARPDLRAAQLSERAADAGIALQNAQRVPDLSLGIGIKRNLIENTYSFSMGITLPIFDRNQGERVKALIQKRRAQNDQKILTNTVLSDTDKAFASFEIQKQRVEAYRTGVLTKADEIQDLSEFSYRSGEASILDLLDAIRTRRETLSSYYQTLFDYQMSLLDLELATASQLVK